MVLESFFQKQLELWPEAAARYRDLCQMVKIKRVVLRDAEVEVMFNPARAVSTCACVDAKTIHERKCFLCCENRPSCQLSMPLPDFDEFEVLVNPFPLAPRHFTIASRRHEPQAAAPWRAMARGAREYEGFVMFYNGASSGASAPDHLHFQAVPIDDIPFLRHGFPTFERVEFDMPDVDELASDIKMILTSPLQNTFVWCEGERVRCVIVKRRNHRPACYYNETGGFKISPGAIDVGGRIVTVRESDFNRVQASDIEKIYAETCYYD